MAGWMKERKEKQDPTPRRLQEAHFCFKDARMLQVKAGENNPYEWKPGEQRQLYFHETKQTNSKAETRDKEERYIVFARRM